MSLSTAFNIINSSFAANAAQTALVSSNIANANTTGYSRKVANLATSAYGGVDVASVTSAANAALQGQANAATSEAAAQQAIANGLSTLAQTVSDSASASSTSGATQNGDSPAALLGGLQNALVAFQASPTDSGLGQAVITAAADLTTSLNSGSAAVNQVREQADSGIASDVASMNRLLSQFASVNASVVSGLQAGQDVTSAEDSRSSIVTQLSKFVGVSTSLDPNGSMSVFTDSGVTLFQDVARTVSFTPTSAFSAGSTGSAVMVDGVPITGSSAPMAVHSGEIAGLATLRDSVAPQYQAQLDQIAGGLVSVFAESDQSATPTQPTLPGLFTFSGATGVPSTTDMTGLAAQIEVNPTVDPSQGGDLSLLQNGGIASPGNPAYGYNPTGSASFTDRIQQLLSGLSATSTFDPSAGLGGSASLSDYTADSVSWLQGQNQQATSQLQYQTALTTQAQTALSNASGVNLDAELTNLLNLENTYTTTAKLLTTTTDMFNALIQATP